MTTNQSTLRCVSSRLLVVIGWSVEFCVNGGLRSWAMTSLQQWQRFPPPCRIGVFVYNCCQHGKMDTPSDCRRYGRSMQSKWIQNTDGSTLFVFAVIQRTITLSLLSSLLPPLFGGGHCHCEGNQCSLPTQHNHKTESRHWRISAIATATRRNPNPSDRIRKTYRLIAGCSTIAW